MDILLETATNQTGLFEYVTLILAAVGSIIAVVLGVMNLNMSKKDKFIDTITTSRIEWINDFRNTMSALLANFPSGKHATLAVINRGGFEFEDNSKFSKLILMLNINDEQDRELIKLLTDLKSTIEYIIESRLIFKDKTNDLTDKTKKLLIAILVFDLDYFTNDIVKKNLTDEEVSMWNNKAIMVDGYLEIMESKGISVDGMEEWRKLQKIRRNTLNHSPSILQELTGIYLKAEWKRVQEESKKGVLKSDEAQNIYDKIRIDYECKDCKDCEECKDCYKGPRNYYYEKCVKCKDCKKRVAVNGELWKKQTK